MRCGVKPLFEKCGFIEGKAILDNRADSGQMVTGIDFWIVLRMIFSKREQLADHDNGLLQYNKYRREAASESKGYVL